MQTLVRRPLRSSRTRALRSLGFDPDSGVEAQFTRDGARRPTTNRSLRWRRWMNNWGFFSAICQLEQQRRFLLYCLEDADDSGRGDERDRERLAPRRRHGEARRACSARRMEKFPDLYRTLTTERNRKWLPRIEAMLHDKQWTYLASSSAHCIWSARTVSPPCSSARGTRSSSSEHRQDGSGGCSRRRPARPVRIALHGDSCIRRKANHMEGESRQPAAGANVLFVGGDASALRAIAGLRCGEDPAR